MHCSQDDMAVVLNSRSSSKQQQIATAVVADDAGLLPTLTCRKTWVSEVGFPPPSFEIRSNVSMMRMLNGSRKHNRRCQGEDAVIA